ncbi:hypothetical protein V1290_004189 [Bradyrhizobium sp. AZCC 1578]
MQLLRHQPVELLEAHDQRPPFVGIDTVGLVIHHDSRMRMHARDAHLDRGKIAAPDRILLGHPVDACDLGFDLHRAFQRARRRDGFARHRAQAAQAKLVTRVPIAAHPLARRHRIRAGRASQTIDRADQCGRRQIEHALACPDHVLGGL